MKSWVCSLLAGIWVWSLLPAQVAAQTGFISRHYSANDGIPETAVRCALQDRRGFIWVGTWDGLCKFDGLRFTTYKRNPESANSLGHNLVINLWEDAYGRLWVAHVGGLDLFNPENEEFHHFPAPNPGSKLDIIKLRGRKDGKLWICAYDGIYIADPETLSIERMTGLPEGRYWSDIAETPSGSVWVTNEHSLIHFDATTNQTSIYNLNDPDSYMSSIYVDEEEKLWNGGNGLNLFDEASKSFTHYFTGYQVTHVSGHSDGKLLICNDLGLLSFDPKTGNHENIMDLDKYTYSIFKDKQGIIWYSSGGGLYQINSKAGKLRSERQYNWVGGIAEDGNHDIWIWSSNGIFQLDPSLRKVHKHNLGTKVEAMCADGDGSILFISPGSRLDRYDFRSKIMSGHTLSVTDRIGAINTFSFVDSFGNIWTGGWDGVAKYNSKTNVIEPLKLLPLVYVTCFLEDPHKNLWIGSNGGLWRYNLISNKLDVFENDPAERQSLSDNSINHMMMDRNQNIWIGTGTGLNKIIKGTENHVPRFANWRTGKSGIPSDFVTCIVDGEDGTLWLVCGTSISHFDPGKGTFRNYDYTDFINPAKFTSGFTFGKGLRMSDGKIILGTHQQGLVVFHPDSLVDNSYVPPVFITDFLIRDQRVPIAKTDADTLAWETPLEKGISYTNEIELTYLQNDFAFEFVALNYVSAENNRYKYRLEPYEGDWIETNANNRIARYTNIDPGTYTFRVIGSNNHGIWNEAGASLHITITPPWWQTWWAYTVYSMIVVGLLLGARRMIVQRERLKANLDLARVEQEKEHFELEKAKEVDQVKSRFFANISHEFRTPITLVLGPLKEFHKQLTNPEQKNLVGSVIRNGQRLQRLINQLLDLSKVEAGKMKLHASHVDIVQLLREIVASYESLSKEKNIRYFFNPEVSELMMSADEEKIEKIVHNLLSNAFKFTQQGGEIILNLKLEEKFAVITVVDSGIGIPSNQLDKVFDRFYQVDSSQTRDYEGSGLGLSLVKELVELHHGKVSVESNQGTGSVFTVMLPLGKEHLREEEIVDGKETYKRRLIAEDFISADGEAAIGSDGIQVDKTLSALPVLLIVEDNADMRRYISKTLTNGYQIVEADNGKEGVRKAEEAMPDLIISDIMMPEMDGYKFCHILKSKELTSHIPVILLTAKADRESKLSGLEIGADDYLSKPFDAEELRLIVRNRIEERRKMRERFRKEIILEPKHIAITSLDEKFLQKVLAVIEVHMGNEKFSIEDLSQEVGYSHIHFYRKIKALSGQTPNLFLRTIRLKRAADLLSSKSDNVSQIAYSIGFSSQSYFIKCFKEQFGMTPGEFTNHSQKKRIPS